ncbi:MAG TPA: cysteine peptidase family C39 domain-containing protein [Pirellulales bacterium]|nr:cysteine peptidase family C39 domain-containing protein [Pirellulales bacterium]
MLPNVIVGIMALRSLGAPAEGRDAKPTNLDWREAVRCGPNCLYVMLFIFGKRVDYPSLVSATEVTDRGTSAAELMRVAERFGIRLAAVRADVGDVERLPLPAIVHFKEAGDRGHYLLLLRIAADDTFTVLECTRGEMRQMSRGDFYDLWTGVALVERRAWNNLLLGQLAYASSAGAAAVTLAAAFLGWSGLRERKRPTAPISF